MQRATSFLLASCLVTVPFSGAALFADGAPLEDGYHSAKNSNIQPFTAKVTRDKVRMRLQPSLESPIVREMKRGEMLVVVDEIDDFFIVTPPSDMKTYIYRTYVLDGVVEGNKVNVRLSPHTEAPVVAQLSTGERINGKISQQNAKWLEISPPAGTKFYISSDFLEKVGDANYLSKYELRQEEVSNLLNSTYLVSQQELQKPFAEINAEQVIENYRKVMNDYPEFPEQATRAREFLAKFQEQYLHKKVEYLEAKTKESALPWNTPKQKPEEFVARNERLKELEQQMQDVSEPQQAQQVYEKWVNQKFASEVNARMSRWIPVELDFYERWATQNGNHSIQDFYAQQQKTAVSLRGILEQYDRPIRNKPGDYILVHRTTRLPIAYLYSTQIDLQDKVGREVTIEGVLRPNNNFAYPAYYVLETK